MIPPAQAQQIVAALDLAASDAEAQRLAERILSDNFCYNEILRALLAEYAPQALRQIRSIQRRDLLERLHIHPRPFSAGATRTPDGTFLCEEQPGARGATPAPAPPRGTTWQARKNQYTDKAEIHAFCSACSQSIVIPHFEEPLGEKPLTFSHCGKNESIPTKVVTEFYRLRSGPTDADRAYEYKTFVDTNKQIVESQAAKDRALAQRLVGANNLQVAQPHVPDELEVISLADKVIAQAEKLLKKGRQ